MDIKNPVIWDKIGNFLCIIILFLVVIGQLMSWIGTSVLFLVCITISAKVLVGRKDPNYMQARTNIRIKKITADYILLAIALSLF